METREPKKGQGVPRETPQQNSLADLQGALVSAFPDVDWAALPSRLEEDGFFEASMSTQVRLMAQVSAGQLAPAVERPAPATALGAASLVGWKRKWWSR